MDIDNKDLYIIIDLLFCYLIPDAWAYRDQKEEMKKRRCSGHSFADLCVYSIVVCSKWDGLFRHRVVTLTGNFLKVIPTVRVTLWSSPNFLITTPE